MATLDQHHSGSYTKLLYIGDSSTGKTGSLVSLLKDGYHFKILDMDNGLDTLVQFGKATCPENLKNVEFETIRDEFRPTPTQGFVKKGTSNAFNDALQLMSKWSEIEDPNTIFVLDSLSAFGKSAFEWAKAMNPTAKDPRQWYFAAQQAVENTIAMLTSDSFRLNVIIITHVNYKEVVEGVHKGYANAIGSALGPTLPKYFNTLVLAESSGSGKNVRRRIKTMPTGIIDLKVPVPQIEAEFPLETGMSDLFKKLKAI